MGGGRSSRTSDLLTHVLCVGRKRPRDHQGPDPYSCSLARSRQPGCWPTAFGRGRLTAAPRHRRRRPIREPPGAEPGPRRRIGGRGGEWGRRGRMASSAARLRAVTEAPGGGSSGQSGSAGSMGGCGLLWGSVAARSAALGEEETLRREPAPLLTSPPSRAFAKELFLGKIQKVRRRRGLAAFCPFRGGASGARSGAPRRLPQKRTEGGRAGPRL